MLCGECGRIPENYKDEMLANMKDCISWLKTRKDNKKAIMYYEKIKQIEHEFEQETFYNCSPGKTKENCVPLQETDKGSAHSPKEGEEEEESPSSGQGYP